MPRSARTRRIDPAPARSYARRVDSRRYITFEPEKRSSQPCIRGRRNSVYHMLDYLVGGMSAEDLLQDFADFTVEDMADMSPRGTRPATVCHAV